MSIVIQSFEDRVHINLHVCACFLTLRHIASKSQSKQAQPYREVAAGIAPSSLMAGIELRVNA
jgi:hypothetical protein